MRVVVDLPVRQELAGPSRGAGDRDDAASKSGYFGEDRGWPMVRNGLQYLLFNSGPVTTTGIEACLFYDPDGGERPTIQLYCAPIVYLDRDVSSAKPTWGVTFTSCLLRPKARGSVTLRSADPAGTAGGRLQFLRRSGRSAADARLAAPTPGNCSRPSRSAARSPRSCCRVRRCTDEAALAKFCGQTVKTNYHPVGTARMGRDDDPDSVVDSQLRVRGIEGLRVIDCSIMPAIVSGNTNAPAMAIGSKAASLIASAHGAAKLAAGSLPG